jgi:hypothetical protein
MCYRKNSERKNNGNSVNYQEEGDNMLLTDRQKQILEQMELPSDYEQLNYTQQHAIKRIEIMLCYLEEKYGIEFSYAGYVPAGAMESEHLTAYPTAEGIGDGANFVTVEPYGETFKDNYSDKEIHEYYESIVTNFVSEYFNSGQVKVVVYRFSASMKSSDEITNASFRYKISTTTLVFVSDTICDEKQMCEFAEEMKLWFEEHEIVSNSRVSLVHTDDVTGITANNFEDCYSNQMLNVNGDFRIIIYGDEIERNQLVPNSRGDSVNEP